MNAAKLREQFVPSLKTAAADKLGIEIETFWNVALGSSGGYVSRRTDDIPFTIEEAMFLAGFEYAWLRAMNVAQGYV